MLRALMNYVEIKAELEGYQRAGRSDLVAKAFQERKALANPPREWRVPFAAIARRANLITTGLKILTRSIFSSADQWRPHPRPEELIEYALLLQKNGSHREAIKIFELNTLHDVPEAGLYRAYCRFPSWHYRTAIPEIEKYIRTQAPSYMTLVAEINLIAAFIANGEEEKAIVPLAHCLERTAAGAYERLRGNCLELRAQVHFIKKNWSDCRADLDEASKIFATEETTDQLFVRKWRAALEATERNDPAPLIAFRAEALSRRHGESVREADRLRLTVEFDEAIFQHLYFGSPFTSYRERITACVGRRIDAGDYRWGAGGAKSARLNELPGVGGIPHRLVDVLARDFYRPSSIGALFAELFPTEHFDIFSSPNRIHQALFRAREWLAEHNLGLEIVEREGAYTLATRPDFALILPLNRGQLTRARSRLDLIRDLPEFNAAEARARLGLAGSSFHRLIQQAIAEGQVERVKKGRAIFYRFTG